MSKKEKTISFKKIKEELEIRKYILRIITAPVEKEIALLNRICADKGHKIIPRNPKIREELKTDIWASTGALCEACGKTFGWWCPKSPDHHCLYFGQKCDQCGQIIPEGSDARIAHIKKANHQGASFKSVGVSTDECLFCGMPEERK